MNSISLNTDIVGGLLLHLGKTGQKDGVQVEQTESLKIAQGKGHP